MTRRIGSCLWLIAVLTLYICSASTVLAAPTTSGTLPSDETWSDTVTITDYVTVPSGVTLTILPGTRIVFVENPDENEYWGHPYMPELIINGSLVAVGTEDGKIVFTGGGITSWWETVSGDIRLEYCQMPGAYIYSAGNVTISNCEIAGITVYTSGSVTLTDNKMFLPKWEYGDPNHTPQDYECAIYCSVSCATNGNVMIARNEIRGSGCGILLDAPNYDPFYGNAINTNVNAVISENDIRGSYFGMYFLNSGSSLALNITGNVIGEQNGGIYCQGYGESFNAFNLEINRNAIFRSKNYGVFCSTYSCTFTGAISENSIFGNGTGIFWFPYGDSSLSITRNDIYENGTGIYLEEYSYYNLSGLISANRVHSNRGNGIRCFGYDMGTLNMEISGNWVYQNGGHGIDWGIVSSGSAGIETGIWLNSIHENTGRGISTGNYYEIFGYEAAAAVAILHNDIQNNANYGIFLMDTGSKINNNNIAGSGGDYDLYNANSTGADARGNFWGAAVTAEMQAGDNPKNISRIYDFYDDSTKGSVNYAEWKNSEILIAPVVTSAIAGNGYVYLSWTPRKAAVGYKVYYGTSSGVYEGSIDAGNVNRDFRLTGLANDIVNYIVVTAYDGDGNETSYSPEIKITPTASAGSTDGTIGTVSFDKALYHGPTNAVITVKDVDLNTDPTTLQSINVQVFSQSDPEGITLTIRETDFDSGIFTSTSFGKDLGFTSEASDDAAELLHVCQSDTIFVLYKDDAPLLIRLDYASVGDVVPPETNFVPSSDLYYDGTRYYAQSNISYSFSATDDASGVDRIEYSIDGSPFVEFTAVFQLNTEGTHAITYKAVDKSGNWETPESKLIIIDVTPPAPPLGLGGVQTDFVVNLSWTANMEEDVFGYNLYRDGIKLNYGVLTQTSYSDLIVSGKAYKYDITAVDFAKNESTFSDAFSVETMTATPVITSPVSGTFFADSEIVVQGNADPGAIVEILVNRVSQGTTIASATGKFSLSGVRLSEGENLITAVFVNSYGLISPVSSALTIPFDSRPQPPSGLAAEPGDTVAIITWLPNPESDIKGYNLYRSGMRSNHDLLTETRFRSSRLTNGKIYSYVVTAVDLKGSESLKTSLIVVIPIAGPEWGRQ
ncbi:MAG: right-handed parallel beta-helix repeat-containing protein [Pseudomonadota bacterium]